MPIRHPDEPTASVGKAFHGGIIPHALVYLHTGYQLSHAGFHGWNDIASSLQRLAKKKEKAPTTRLQIVRKRVVGIGCYAGTLWLTHSAPIMFAARLDASRRVLSEILA